MNFFEEKGGISHIYMNSLEAFSKQSHGKTQYIHYKTIEKLILCLNYGLLELRFLNSA